MSIFTETAERYGEDQAREALELIDQYVDKHYPEATGRVHPEIGRGKRMGFAAKLLDCMYETGADFDHIRHALHNALDVSDEGKVDDPTIYYATTPTVMGYWLLLHSNLSWKNFRDTIYKPVSAYF